MRLVRGGAWVAARIIFDGKRWGAEINGQPAGPPHADAHLAAGVMRVWQSGRVIDLDEYTYLLTLAEHAARNPAHPSANPHRPVDIDRLPPVF